MKTPTKTILILGTGLALLAVGYLQGYLHGTVGGFTKSLRGLVHNDEFMQSLKEGKHMNHWIHDMLQKIVGNVEVTVDQKPFGMHVKKGTAIVAEVFPGFPAEKYKIRPGCIIAKVDGHVVMQGTWMEAFQKAAVPFNISLVCPPLTAAGNGPINSDLHNHRVLVVSKPFGMNIQVNVVPRVIEVLPGYPAEKAGVKRGFVLKAVNDQEVNAKNWYDIWEKAEPPCTLTFDKSVPVHKDNPFYNATDNSWLPLRIQQAAMDAKKKFDEEDDDDEDIESGNYSVYACTVNSMPFGMHVSSVPGKPPMVVSVVSGMPADKEGVKVGDILTKVAGRSTESETWFSSFQQAVPPFGLEFKRPINVSAAVSVVLDEANQKQVLTVLVSERPFGMHVRRGSNVVEEVFPGFIAQKKGVKKGCMVLEVAGNKVAQGTWMEAFQNSLLPFEIKLLCPVNSTKKKGALAGKGAVDVDATANTYKVIVHQRPYGMNVQVNVVPRVVEVLPGSPAEAAGVKPGFVLLEVNNQKVTSGNWFDVWQKAPTPSTLLFHTNMSLHKDNPYIEAAEGGGYAPVAPRSRYRMPFWVRGEGDGLDPDSNPFPEEYLQHLPAEVAKAFRFSAKLMKPPQPDESDLYQNFTDFRCKVTELPFGMQVAAPFRTRPVVQAVTEGLPAAKEGIRPGDVLVEVAGLPVTAETWFQQYQQATPPFGLRFRRPDETQVPKNFSMLPWPLDKTEEEMDARNSSNFEDEAS